MRVNSNTLSITTPVIRFNTTTLMKSMKSTHPTMATPLYSRPLLVSLAMATHCSPVTSTNRVYIARPTPFHALQASVCLNACWSESAFTQTTAMPYRMNRKRPDIQESSFMVLSRPSASMTSSLKNFSTLITRATRTIRSNRKMRSTPRLVPSSPTTPRIASTVPVHTRNRSSTFHESNPSWAGQKIPLPCASTRSPSSTANSTRKTTSTAQDQVTPESPEGKLVCTPRMIP
mmetsp:Transcript_67565/g.154964  ORF Transcript_67565/g.154964 Transcript_67565/m.154964 type:complete len:232 (-) Transcript_67565:1413-2108(-)